MELVVLPFVFYLRLKRYPPFFSMFSRHQALLERTAYTLDVTTGQRKYGGPPPESAHSGPQPTVGTEVQNTSSLQSIKDARSMHFYLHTLLSQFFKVLGH